MGQNTLRHRLLIAVGWLLSVSLSVSDVLFMLVIRAVAVGWLYGTALAVLCGGTCWAVCRQAQSSLMVWH